mgnify:CR=1 FL=1
MNLVLLFLKLISDLVSHFNNLLIINLLGTLGVYVTAVFGLKCCCSSSCGRLTPEPRGGTDDLAGELTV